MRNFFTKHFLLFGFILLSMNLMGQKINNIAISEPENLKGYYPILRPTWGSQEQVEITGKPVFALDASATPTFACDSILVNADAIEGNIAFIDRGTCGFSNKAYYAQKANAIAVIICNNDVNNPNALIGMTAGDFGDDIVIPVFATSYNTCLKIRSAIVDGSLSEISLVNYCEATEPVGDDIIWGIGEDADGNRGDFKGGLNGWTVNEENKWEWNGDGEILKGAYGGAILRAYSGCNGIMLMNSDYLDNGGVQGADGQGPCPTGYPGSVSTCVGDLISPNINLEDFNVSGLVLEFTQITRNLRSVYYISTSFDGGLTWQDTVYINQDIEVNSQNVVEQRKSYALSNTGGAKQIMIKFTYEGLYYYWGIDDVVLRDQSIVDAKINTSFFAVAPTLKVPASQVVPLYFLADVSNIGNVEATNTTLNVAILDESQNAVFAAQEALGTLGSGQSIEKTIFSDTFTPEAKPGSYLGGYFVQSDVEDAKPEDNEVLFTFDVTANTFGTLFSEEEVGQVYMFDILDYWRFNNPDFPTKYVSVGNAYYLPKGNGYTVDKVRFGLNNPSDELEKTGFVQVDLYEWKQEGGGVDRAVGVEERTLVGRNSVYLEGLDDYRNIEIPLYGVDEEGFEDENLIIELKDETQYVLIAHSRPDDISYPRYEFLIYTDGSLTDPYSRSIYPEATNTIIDNLDLDWYSGSFYTIDGEKDNEQSRVFSSVGLNGNGGTYAYTKVYLEMDIKEASSTYNIAKTGSARVFPNPAARELYIDVTLDNVSDVRVELISVDGKVVTTKSFDNVLDSRLKLDLNSVASGSYTAMIHTNNGVIAKKVIVQK